MYRVLEAVGPDHDKVFRVEVSVGGEVLGMGVGPSRRVAETAAAAEAVEVFLAREAAAAPSAAEAAAEAAGAVSSNEPPAAERAS